MSLLPCLPVICHNPLPDVGNAVAGDAAKAVLSSLTGAVLQAAAWLIDQVMGAIVSSTSPDLTTHWFTQGLADTEEILVLVALPLLLVATIGAVLRQDARRLARIWAVGLPVAMFAGLAGSQFVGLGLSVTDELCGIFTGPQGHQLAPQYREAMQTIASYPEFLQMVVAAITVVGALVLWLELIVREAAVYLTVFFMPVVLAAYIWPATATVARRLVEILCSLILSKLVVVAALTLGMGALGQPGDVGGPVAGAAMVLLAAFAPFAVFRLAPVVETAAIGHLEGMSRRPGQTATRMASTAAGAPYHPAVQAARANRDPGPALQATDVVAQAVPEHPVGFRTSGEEMETIA